MLTGTTKHRIFWGLLVSIMILQVLLAVQTELFGDESFYWLESRFLQWSYSEIPGFVPWLNAVSTALLPQHPFFLRLPFLLACWSLPWLAFSVVKQISLSRQSAWQGALLALILPLVGLTGVLAIADVWLLFFTLLSILLWLRLTENQQYSDALFLGLTLMLAVNVHIRFWFILFLACIAAVVIYKQSLLKLKVLWQITLPLTLLGFVPIILFNAQHDFPLIGFQLGERNPWQFQLSHLWFFLGQIIITTPLVFYMCLMSLKKPVNEVNKQQAIKFIQLLAILYWLLYALLGFFSDNLRTNTHWPLPAYLLLLLVAASFYQHHPTLKKWAIVTGGMAHVFFLIGFYLLLQVLPVTSNNHKQLINNAIGWQQLIEKTQQLRQPGQMIIADYFMTAAALNYYHVDSALIPALSHPMNIKHGREFQLSLMDLLYRDTPDQSALVVVEHTALKLGQQIPYYQQSCEQLNGLRLIDDLSIRQGSKLYYFFHTNTGRCELPPIVYHDYQQGTHTGWVMVNQRDNIELFTVSDKEPPDRISNQQSQPLGQAELFSTLDASQYQLIDYQVVNNKSLQISVQTNQLNIATQRFYHSF